MSATDVATGCIYVVTDHKNGEGVLLRPEDVAHILGASEEEAWDLIEDDKIPSFLVGDNVDTMSTGNGVVRYMLRDTKLYLATDDDTVTYFVAGLDEVPLGYAAIVIVNTDYLMVDEEMVEWFWMRLEHPLFVLRGKEENRETLERLAALVHGYAYIV